MESSDLAISGERGSILQTCKSLGKTGQFLRPKLPIFSAHAKAKRPDYSAAVDADASGSGPLESATAY
jgi:hypothetical protein